MRNELPSKAKNKETGIINLDNSKGLSLHNNNGSHWVGYYINNDSAMYYDSYGLAPPDEFIKYIGNRKLLYNTDHDQIKKKTCGYWVILWLLKVTH